MGFFLRSIRWKSASSKTLKACPRCGSTNIKLSSKLDVWLTPRQYVCNNCGYIGPIILEIGKKEATKKEAKNENS